MVDRVMAMPEGTRLLLLAPVVRGKKGEYRKELAEWQRRGFERVKVNGTLHQIAEAPKLDKKLKHDIEVVVDRIVVRDGIAQRLADSFETALGLADGIAYAENADTRRAHRVQREIRLPGQRLHHRGDRAAAVLLQLPARRLPGLRRPRHARPSSTRSWWCRRTTSSLKDGAIAPWTGAQSPYYDQTLESLARHFKVRHDDALAGPARRGAPAPSCTAPAMRWSRSRYKDGLRAYEVKKPFEGVHPEPASAATRKPTTPGCARTCRATRPTSPAPPAPASA